MEDRTFDALTERLGTDGSRRRVLGGMLATVTGLTGLAIIGNDDAEAKRRRKKKKVQMCENNTTIKVKKNKVDKHLAHGDYLGACINACPLGRCNVQTGQVCCPPGSAQNTDSCRPAGGTCCGAGGFVEGIGAQCCANGSKGVSCPVGQTCCPAGSTNACAASAAAC